MQHMKSFSQVTAAFLIVAASSAVAADKTLWTGRDLDNNSTVWTCSNTSGNDWKLKKNGTTFLEYEGVTSTAEFVELQVKGTKTYDRLRMYNDKLSLNKEGSKTGWIQLAKGKWSN
jgi:hypothetical protein